MGACLSSAIRRLSFLAGLLCLWPFAALAHSRTPFSLVPPQSQKPAFSSRLEKDGSRQESPSLLASLHIRGDGQIGIICGGDHINSMDSGGRLSAQSALNTLGQDNSTKNLYFGIAPVMQTYIQTIYGINGLSVPTGMPGEPDSVLTNPGDITGQSQRLWTIPTGQYFSYVSQTPLPDNWGQTTASWINSSGPDLMDIQLKEAGSYFKLLGAGAAIASGAEELLPELLGAEASVAADSGLIGVTSGESSALARQIYGIQVNGQPAVSSIEAFGSRAGSTFRGLGGPSATSDLDIIVTLNESAANPAGLATVNSELNEIGAMFQGAKGFPVNPIVEIPGLPSVKPSLLQTPFIPLKP